MSHANQNHVKGILGEVVRLSQADKLQPRPPGLAGWKPSASSEASQLCVSYLFDFPRKSLVAPCSFMNRVKREVLLLNRCVKPRADTPRL